MDAVGAAVGDQPGCLCSICECGESDTPGVGGDDVMKRQRDLRTRIAAVLAEEDGMNWDEWSKPSQDGYLLRADAVIRELQLTEDGGVIVGCIHD